MQLKEYQRCDMFITCSEIELLFGVAYYLPAWPSHPNFVEISTHGAHFAVSIKFFRSWSKILKGVHFALKIPRHSNNLEY